MLVRKGIPVTSLPKKAKNFYILEQAILFYPRKAYTEHIEIVSNRTYSQMKPSAEVGKPKFVSYFRMTNELAFYPIPDRNYHVKIHGLIRMTI